jgi:hypothetical protein
MENKNPRGMENRIPHTAEIGNPHCLNGCSFGFRVIENSNQRRRYGEESYVSKNTTAETSRIPPDRDCREAEYRSKNSAEVLEYE